MILRILAFAVICLIAVCALSASEHARQNADLPLVRAGYSVRCDPVPGGPIVKNKPVLTYQRQRGIA